MLALLALASIGLASVPEHQIGSDSYYEVLGVSEAADTRAVKKNYRKLAMLYHPDKSKAADAEANFKRVAEAYEVLSNDAHRKKYDGCGHDKACFKEEDGGGSGGGGGGGGGGGFGGGFDFGFNARDTFRDAFDGRDPVMMLLVLRLLMLLLLLLLMLLRAC